MSRTAGRERVTVGLPVYNAEATLEATLGALLAQTHRKLEIICSDNASTDRTRELLADLTAGDERVRIVEHPVNRGWQFNFRFTLDQARSDYFMWLGADDLLAPSFVAENLAALEADPEAVTSVSRVRWLHDGVAGAIAPGTAPLLGSPRENVARYLRHARDNSRFYGIHRTRVLRDAFPAGDFFALDIAIMLGTLREGTHLEVPEVLLERERNAPSSYAGQIERDARGFPDRLLPLRGFTRAVVRELRVPLSARALWWLLVRNAFEHARYWGATDRLYGRLMRPVAGGLEAGRQRATRDA